MPTQSLSPDAPGDECNVGSESGCSACNDHYTCVDEFPSCDGDPSYIVSVSSGYERDLYNIEDSTPSGVINNMTLYVCGRCQYSQQDHFKFAIKAGVGGGAPDTVYESAATRLNQGTYSTLNKVYLTNPRTGSAWTWDEIDNLQVGCSIRESEVGGWWSRVSQVYIIVDHELAGWSGEIAGVTDPAKIMGVAKADIAEVKGVA